MNIQNNVKKYVKAIRKVLDQMRRRKSSKKSYKKKSGKSRGHCADATAAAYVLFGIKLGLKPYSQKKNSDQRAIIGWRSQTTPNSSKLLTLPRTETLIKSINAEKEVGGLQGIKIQKLLKKGNLLLRSMKKPK